MVVWVFCYKAFEIYVLSHIKQTAFFLQCRYVIVIIHSLEFLTFKLIIMNLKFTPPPLFFKWWWYHAGNEVTLWKLSDALTITTLRLVDRVCVIMPILAFKAIVWRGIVLCDRCQIILVKLCAYKNSTYKRRSKL